jgi:hypothetical protein
MKKKKRKVGFAINCLLGCLLLFDSELFYLVDIFWHESRIKHASTDDETVVKHKHMYKMDSKIVNK